MRFMRLTEVIKDTGLGRSSIYKRIAQGEFPKPVPLGGRTKLTFLSPDCTRSSDARRHRAWFPPLPSSSCA